MKHALGIVIKNRIDFTLKCLEALKKCKQKNYDLFIINNNSSESETKILTESLQDFNIKEYKTFNEDIDLPVVWNYFLYKTKKYEFRTKLDNDIVVPNKRFLDDMANLSIDGLNAIIPLNKPLKFKPIYYSEYSSVPHLYGACFQIPKKTFKRLGYFNEKMPRMIDIEYSRRCIKSGFKLRYVKNYSVQHLGAGKNNTTEQDWSIVLQKGKIARKNFYCRMPANSVWEVK